MGQAVSTSVGIEICRLVYCCSDEQRSTLSPVSLALSLTLNAQELTHLHCLQPSSIT